MVRVILAVAEATAEKNPYLLQLAAGLREEGVGVRFWSWPAALLGRREIVHIHWPELLYKGRSRRETVWKSSLTCLLLIKSRLVGMPLVWTVHNQEPHNRLSRFSAFMDKLVRKNVTAIISINEANYNPEHVGAALSTKIPHGHYVDWFKKHAPADPTKMAACFVGQVRSYKGVIELVEAFRELDDAEATLCIAGEPSPAELGIEIEHYVSVDPRISARLYFLSDKELVSTVTTSSLVILPYKQMFNSGALLLALSMGRPVLAPHTEINVLMQKEFGSDWVRLYSGPISAEKIRTALMQGRPPSERPDLERRGWDNVAQLHRITYETALRQTNSIFTTGKKIG